MFDHWIYDADSWCEFCLPVPADSPEVADGSGEQDTPAHCSQCRRPLEHSLTSDGVGYAVGALLSYLRDPDRQAWRLVVCDTPGDYFHGSREIEVLRGWAEELRNYALTPRQTVTVELFLKRTAPPTAAVA